MSRREPRVFGIPSPWSGDEREPVPPTYWLWFRAYKAARVARHVIALHDWRPALGGVHCDWCGARKADR